MLKKLKKVNTLDRVLNQLQDNVSESLTELGNIPLSNGILIEDIDITTGQANVIDHKLGREVRGYIVVKRNADSVIWNETPVLYPTKQLDLRSSANVTISIWVF